MEDYWNSQVLEVGAVNITGFRILQPYTSEFSAFLSGWRSQDPREDAKKQISVSDSYKWLIF